MHTPPSGKFISKEKGFVYIVSNEGFRNEPEGSWQFIKETGEIEFGMIVETEKADFKYPVEFSDDLDPGRRIKIKFAPIFIRNKKLLSHRTTRHMRFRNFSFLDFSIRCEKFLTPNCADDMASLVI